MGMMLLVKFVLRVLETAFGDSIVLFIYFVTKELYMYYSMLYLKEKSDYGTTIGYFFCVG